MGIGTSTWAEEGVVHTHRRVFFWAAAAWLLTAPRPAAARRAIPERVPMSLAKVQLVDAACRRVFGVAPSTVQICRETVLPSFLASVPRSPFCPRAGALVARMPACVEALAASIVFQVTGQLPAVGGGGFGLPTAGGVYDLQRDCSEARLCGPPF